MALSAHWEQPDAAYSDTTVGLDGRSGAPGWPRPGSSLLRNAASQSAGFARAPGISELMGPPHAREALSDYFARIPLRPQACYQSLAVCSVTAQPGQISAIPNEH